MTTRQVPTIDVLRRARALVADERTWTAHAAARTASRNQTVPTSPAAVCWCAVGAISLSVFHETGDSWPFGRERLMCALDEFAGRRGYGSLIDANDTGGRLVALAILDDAIAELEGR